MSLFETSIGGGPPLHVHDRDDECLYVLDGELSIRCGGGAFGIAAGSLCSPAGARTGSGLWVGPPGCCIDVPGGIEDSLQDINTAPATTSAAGSVRAMASAWSLDESANLGMPAWLVPASERPARSHDTPVE